MENKAFTDKKNKTAENIINILAKIILYFVSAGFIMWGWNVIAPHLNAPLFSYWEIFAMRMALTYITSILWQK